MQTLAPSQSPTPDQSVEAVPFTAHRAPGCMHTCGPACAPDPDGSLASPGLRDYHNGIKRWPINTTVLDSPACAMAEYAEYPTRLFLVTGSSVQVAAETMDEMLDKGRPWAHEGSRIVRVPIVPYYETTDGGRSGCAVGSAPIAGGGWGGECGATVWIRNSTGRFDELLAARQMLHALGGPVSYIQDNPGSSGDVSMLQAWWINGIAHNKPTLDGFWLRCEQKRKGHGPLCTALDLEWNWRHYAPFTDMGHDTQLELF